MEVVTTTTSASKKAAKVLLSVSAFSAIVVLSFPFVVNTLYDIYVSAFWKQIASSGYTGPEKQVVFLFCNGLLVVIFTNSATSLTRDASENDTTTTTTRTPTTENPGRLVVSNDDKEDTSGGELYGGSEEMGKELVVFEDYHYQEDEEDEEEEGIDELVASRDEFNKKCEDFIRRVKQEIKLGGP